MKPFWKILGLTLFSITMLIYCRKETQTSLKPTQLSNQEIIDNARKWYEKKHTTLSPLSNAKTTQESTDVPDWSNSTVVTALANIQITSTPTYIHNNTGVVKQLITITDGTGFVTRTIEIIPTTAYFEATAFNNRFSTFTGTVKVYAEGITPLSSVGYSGGGSSGTASIVSRTQLSPIGATRLEGIDLAEIVVTAQT